MKSYGAYLAARTLQDASVRTLRGMDRVTGMPVLLYTLPRAQELPHLTQRRLLPYSDTGWQDGVFFAVAELSMHAAPAGDPLLTARGALEALEALHAQGTPHGGLTPAQLWTSGEQVWVAGAGLPWGALGGGFDAPEGGKSPAADLYALGCSLEALGGVPDALRGLLSPDPAGRPSASAALKLLAAAPPDPLPPEPEMTDLLPPAPAPQTGLSPQAGAQLPGGTASPEAFSAVSDARAAKSDEPAIRPGRTGAMQTQAVQTQTVPAPVPRIQMGFGEPRGEASPTSELPRPQPIRIGWEEDNSWRAVRSPDEQDRPLARGPARRWLWPLALLLAVLLVLAAWLLLRHHPARVAQNCCSVTFRVSGGQAQVKISVLRAPRGSGLSSGDVIGTVPGSLKFPGAAGTYNLQAQATGYSPMTFQISVPSSTPVEIDLRR